ncbi:MAG: signal recognition particle-docking protein FtsY [Eubacteriales bacterium]
MSSEKKGLFGRLKEGLTKTRDQIVSGMDVIFHGASEIDDDFYEEIEELLIMGDVGVHTTQIIMEELQKQVKEQRIKDPVACRQILMETLENQMKSESETTYVYEQQQSVILLIGVNGVGKTTSVGKLASDLKQKGKNVLLAAADTFRAAATEQLVEWSKRAGVDVITGSEGCDPSAVVYDALQAAKARKVDVLICDTAGRLHNKKNLMEELKKMDRIIEREFPNAHRENLVVVDASTGQNALNQAREFGEVSDVSGIILTKMDGTAKGGIAIAIQSELQVPVKYIGVGEKIEDLQKFDATQFIKALFQQEESEDSVLELSHEEGEGEKSIC